MRWRDRLLGDARFQRWAVRFWLTRPVARREARALFDLCAGFVYAQVLAACVDLDLFERVAARPVPVNILAAQCNVPEPAMRMLAAAAASLRLLKLRRGGVGLGMLGAAMRANPGVAVMVRHHRLFYADLAEPVALLRGGVDTRLKKFWPYAGGAGEPEAYSAIMAATQPMLAAEILDAYDVSRHARVLDVAGGDGRFLAELAARAPSAKLMLFDLPAVVAAAARHAALAGRLEIYPGDLALDALPKGADLITLVRVLHDHDDARALALLRAARAALAPGGTLLLAEPMAGAKGAAPIGAAYFGFYMLAMGSGRPRLPEEIIAMLREVGFTRARTRRTRQPLLIGVITAQA